MKWEKQNSDKFEDRRGKSVGKKTLLGGGAIGIVVLLLTLFGGEKGQMIGNIIQQVQPAEQSTTTTTETRELTEEEIMLGEFSKSVFVYNNKTWEKIFAQNNCSHLAEFLMTFYIANTWI